VLIGNAVYFACSRFLPPGARHNTGGFDFGLASISGFTWP
jgi:hypothetical protein